MNAILMPAEFWMNSQLSIAKYSGGIKIDGVQYVVVGTDLLRKDWIPVYTKLGRERTIGLIKNGTSLKVAKEMIKAKDDVEQIKLDLK